MNDTPPTTKKRGRLGCGLLLWLIGVPLPVIIILFLLLQGC